MPKRVVCRELGPPERLSLESVAAVPLEAGQVRLAVHGQELVISPVTPASAPVLLGEDLRDLGAAVAVRVVEARGGAVEVDGETLIVRLA